MKTRPIMEVWRRLSESLREWWSAQNDDLMQLEKLAEEIRKRPDPFTTTTDLNGDTHFHVKPNLHDVSRLLKP